MKRYAQLMWDWHVFDKSTGEINRHSDRKKGYAFTFTSASIMSQWGFVAERTELEPYRSWCRTVAGFHWAGRNPQTDMFDSGGDRGPSGIFTTMQATVARDWILVGRQTHDDELVRRGRAILDTYAKYGYDETTGLTRWVRLSGALRHVCRSLWADDPILAFHVPPDGRPAVAPPGTGSRR